MTDGGLMVLQLIGMGLGVVFLIFSAVLTLKMAADDRTWLYFLLAIPFLLFVTTFFVDLGASFRWFSIFGIIGAFMIGWLIYLYELSIIVFEWFAVYWKTVLISLAVIVATSFSLYAFIQYDLYSEFFYGMIGLTAVLTIIGKPPALRRFVLSLTKLSFLIVVICLGIYGIGAVGYMAYNYGFSIFLEFGSDRFWLAWMNYVIFTQYVFGFIVVNLLILMFIPGLSLPAFGVLMMGLGRNQQDDDDFYKAAKIRKETGYW